MTVAVQRKIYKKLAWLNELPEDEAIYVFRECSGNDVWSRVMAMSRPFPMLEQLYETAEKFWRKEDFEAVQQRLNSLLER